MRVAVLGQLVLPHVTYVTPPPLLLDAGSADTGSVLFVLNLFKTASSFSSMTKY